ncbi:unnamed protein product [Arabis nemorensis]|uniref:Uncharacterized protein n=1 Tax=Arabis nemorensis TaxID=586526 RepID=A0A565BYA3_9BRAS|nr:unnamed protein product [Arabis nemorensis]
MNHTNTHHRLRKASSTRSPLREANLGKGNLVIEEDASSSELRPEKRKVNASGFTDSAADRSGTKSTTADANDADVSISERISDGCGEGEEFGPKTWNLRPRKPPPTKKRSIGNGGLVLKSCSGSLPENKTQGTVRTEAIRSRNCADAKMAITERKEKKPRLSISLSKLEIDEDIYALTGSKPSRRPKKRAKNIQKQLDTLTKSQIMLERIG